MLQAATTEKVTDNFYAWELRGRGWHTFPNPVQLEPMHVPFFPFSIKDVKPVDDAYRPTLISRFGNWISDVAKAKEQKEVSYEEFVKSHYDYNAYDLTDTSPLIGFIISYPEGTKFNTGTFIHLLTMLSGTEHAVSFEIIGTSILQIVQIVCSQPDAFKVKLQLKAYCPEATIYESELDLDAYVPDPHMFINTIEFGLANEFTIPLKRYDKGSGETYKSFFSILDHLRDNEQIILQVLFHGAINPWGKSVMQSVTADDGKCFFLDAPEMFPLAKDKVSSPFFAVGIRTFVQAHIEARLMDLSREIVNTISKQSATTNNWLIPMTTQADNQYDYIERITHRTGMLLNTEELANFVHYPDTSQVISKLVIKQDKARKAPASTLGHDDYVIGRNITQEADQLVTLDIKQRLRHIHIIGATGTGKSTLLVNLIAQDIFTNKGLALLDPHGDLVETVLTLIPENRIQDVVLVDPSDFEYPIGLNLLEAKTEIEKIVLSSDLVTAIKRQSTSWGDQMTAILSNAINAFLESSEGGTLFDLRRFLVEDSFRNTFLQSVSDPTILHFWKQEYKMLRQNAIGPILVRLDSFLRPKVIRNMMAQKNGLNFNDLIGGNKIILVKLPQGLIGEENSHLLGTLIVSKIQQAAQARQAISQNDRNPFFLYLDEFQNFITPSMSAILSGSRKYGLGLILAHQDMEQVSKRDSELANSIISNPGTRICFRVGDIDARRLEHGFSNFDSKDLQNLHVGQAITKVDTASQAFNLTSFPMPSIGNKHIREQCIAFTRSAYAKPREQVERYIFTLFQETPPAVSKTQAQEAEEVPPVPKPLKHIPVEVPPYEPVSISNPSLEQEGKEYIEHVKERERNREHRYLQNLIKKMAESKGFKAVIEEPINGGEGKVDVGISRDQIRIAVEISVTNSINYESQNVLKCLNAGYRPVVMCCDNVRHLKNIKERTLPQIEGKYREHIKFYSPIELFAFLDTLLQVNEEQKEKRFKGYRVKVTYKNNRI